MSKEAMGKMICRSFCDYRAETLDDGRGRITGVPIVFEQPTVIGGMFEETIARDAISKEVLQDVALFYNHDLNSKPLARTRTKSLTFDIKDDGVHMDARINLDRTDAKDLYLAIGDGDIDGMSFMFRVQEDEWSDLDTDLPKRRITKIGYIQEVSAVNYPAYAGTSINARADGSADADRQALDSARAEHRSVDTDTLELLKLKADILYKGV